MTTYTKQLPRGKHVKCGDAFTIHHKGQTYEYKVLHTHATCPPPHGSNAAVLIAILGRRYLSTVRKVYGKKYEKSWPQGGWPCVKEDDYGALTRLINLLFKKASGFTKADKLAEKRAAEAHRRLAASAPLKAREIAGFITKSSFGCQQERVVAILSVLVDFDLRLLIK